MGTKIDLRHTEFNGFPDNYQTRPHLCKEFIRLLNTTADTEVLLLEARPGIGATSLCAEYVESLSDFGILLTIHAGSRAGYSLPFLIDQAVQQAYVLLEDVPRQLTLENASGEWHRVLTRLQRKARSQHKKLHLVVDGLYQIPSDDERYVHDLVSNVLALGNSDVRHVITWREGGGTPKFLSRYTTRKVPIPPLSDQECRQYLSASGVDLSKYHEISDATHGVPALLASTVRLHKLGKLDSGTLHLSLAGFYEVEWITFLQSQADSGVDVEKMFAFLVFSKRQLAITELAELVNEPISVVIQTVAKTGFATITRDNYITFASNTQREFLKTRLENLRTSVLNAFVDRIARDSSSSDTVQLLPNYFEELGRDQDIVALLTPENLDLFLGETQSLTALRRRNELGFRAAKRANVEVEAYRFGLQTSLVLGLESDNGNEARLAALATTGRLDAALDLAQGEATKEARLLLLSQYVKVLHGRGLHVDGVLADTISNLIAEVDFTADKERALAIAENLVGPFPELGIILVEQSAEGAKDYQDIAFTHLVLKSQVRSDEGAKVAAEKYTSRVSDSRLQGFLRATEALFREKSADEIRRATSGLDGRQRSFLLRQWLTVHPKGEDAIDIANYALDEVARDPTYLPTPADLHALCRPIADAKDNQSAMSLLQRIEAQLSALLDITGTVDRFKLDLEIARARTAWGLEGYDDALSTLYVQASDVTNAVSKLECFSWMRSSIEEFKELPPAVGVEFRNLCEASIQESVERCLATTAEQIDIIKGAIWALVESNPAAVVEIVVKLNTENRRDSAYSYFIERLVSRRSKEPIPLALIRQALESIVDDGTRWSATVNCLRLLAQRLPVLDDSAQSLIDIGCAIEDPLGRGYAWRWMVTIASHYNLNLDLKWVASQFSSACEQVDQVWHLSALYYWFIESLAKVDRAFAESLLIDYECSSLSRRPVNSSYAKLVSNLARLALISFAGTLRQRLDSDDDLYSLFSVIDNVPSLLAQVDLYTDVALRAHTKNRRDVFDKVCEQRLSKLVNKSASECSYLKKKVIEVSYVALFIWNQQYADQLVSELQPTKQDECRRETIIFYATGNTTSEPYQDPTYRSARVSYAIATTMVSLIEKMSEDSTLASSIEILSHAATSRPSTSEITAHQRAELALRLQKTVDKNLPDQRNIKHDGWKILAQAYCFKLSSESLHDKWKDVIDQAKAIPNISDSVFVLTALAGCLPKKLAAEKSSVLKEAETRLGMIPSLLDRVQRGIAISNATLSTEVEQVIAKRLLTKAMADSLLIRDAEAASCAQKDIIDLAFQLDRDFAVELCSMIDEDPARLRAKTEAETRLESQRKKVAVADKRYSEIDGDIPDVGEIAWEMLGNLNAGKVAPQKQEELGSLLMSAYRRSLFDVMGFYYWYLRNLQEKYDGHHSQARSILLPIFEVTRLAALLAEKIGRRICGGVDCRDSTTRTSPTSSFIATPGVRDDALAFIKKWMDPLKDNEVLICDPYFKPDDLDFIKEISFSKDGVSFVVLTCTLESSSKGDLESEYSAAWSKIAYVEPPPLRAVHVTYGGDKKNHPIHDRWIFCGNHGLRVGTSVGSLGLSKLSEISTVSAGDVPDIKAALDPFVQMRERWIDGQRLRYQVVQW